MGGIYGTNSAERPLTLSLSHEGRGDPHPALVGNHNSFDRSRVCSRCEIASLRSQ
jgi:hypothetical protein